MRNALLIIAGLALVAFIVISVVLPQMAGGEARDAAAALVAGAEAAKGPVSAAAEKAANIVGSGANVKIPAKSDAKYGDLKWIVEQNGVIRGWNEKNAIEIALTPSLNAGKVSWACRGYPAVAMSASCGGK